MKRFILLFFPLLFCLSTLKADELVIDPPKVWEADCFPCGPLLPCPDPLQLERIENQIVVDLQNPTYDDGILSTTEGGILVAPNLRVQAQVVQYTRRFPDELSLYCEGDLLIDFEGHILTGKCLYYDFLTNTGMLIDGKGGSHPWYIGGEEIFFHPSGEIVIRKGYVTTSEGEIKKVKGASSSIVITPNKVMTAKHTTLGLYRLPLFYFPYFKFNLNAVTRLPLAVRFGWGGFLGTNLSLRYRFAHIGDLKGFARLDGYLGRGLGAGIETEYAPKCSNLTIFTQNYWAHDLSIDNRTERDRYRFAGTFFNRLFNDTTTVNITYDKVSDGQFASHYRHDDFALKTAGKTQLEVRRQAGLWIANLFTQVRVNSFQSINQELPTLSFNMHPVRLKYGIMFDTSMQASFLSYVFSDRVRPSQDFSSGRFALRPKVYRPLSFGPLTLTPEAGFIGIGYTNGEQAQGATGQALAELGMRGETSLKRGFGKCQHVVTPYVNYRFITNPAAPLNKVHIFTIKDANARLNQLRFGMRQALFSPCCNETLFVDVWANAFFDPQSDLSTLPKGYLEMQWSPIKHLFFTTNFGYNFQKRQRDFLNVRAEVTFSETMAASVEFKGRHRYDWRKADFYSFLLDFQRSELELRDSVLSERRNIVLTNFFVRLSPEVSVKGQVRNGWHLDPHEKGRSRFFEYQFDLVALLLDHWRLVFGYEKRTNQTIYSFSLNLVS